MKERLADFNHRLDELIGHSTFTAELSSEQASSDLFKKYERDRRKLIERHNEEISQLKLQLLQLQQHSSSHFS